PPPASPLFPYTTLFRSLGETEPPRLRADQLAREVVAGGFGERGQRVRGHALPRRDAGVDAEVLALVSEVLAPFPGRDRHLRRRLDLGRYPDLAVAPEDDRPDVGAALEGVRRDHLTAGLVDGFGGEGDVDAIDLRRVEQPQIGRAHV